MQEAEFVVAAPCSRALELFLYEARGILRVVRRCVNRMTAYDPCEYFGKVENVN